MTKNQASCRIAGFVAIWLSLLTGLAGKGTAQTIADEARQILQDRLGYALSPQSYPFEQVTRHSGITVAENEDPPAFVLFSEGTNGLSMVGYSGSNSFFPGTLPDTLQWDMLTCLGSDYDPQKELLLKTGDDEVTPLISTKWSQDERFNYFCPADHRALNGKTYPGCMAVAMGQIIRYYQHFNTFHFETSFVHPLYGELRASPGEYNWAYMDDQPVTVDREVSQLLYDLGVGLHMNYGFQRSSATNYRAKNLFHQLGYDGAQVFQRNRMTEASWIELFVENLKAHQPLLVTGGGHAFVCDGMDAEGMFHFNLGGSGFGDGYYTMQVVFGFFIEEVFAELAPANWLPKPDYLEISVTGSDQISLGIHQSGSEQPSAWRIYLDGVFWQDIQHSDATLTGLAPGKHVLQASALFDQGESVWTGPEGFSLNGTTVFISGVWLDQAIQASLNSPDTDRLGFGYSAAELSGIRSLEIAGPINSLEGLQYCTQLRELAIIQLGELPIDLSPLTDLQQLRVLRLEGIRQDEMDDLNLTRLVDLELRRCEIPNLGWLADPEEMLFLSIDQSSIEDLSGLHRFTRLFQLRLHNLSVSTPDFLDHCPELWILDLSGNQIESLDEMNWPPNLRELDLSGNRIERMNWIRYLPDLQILDLSDNQLEELFLVQTGEVIREINVSHNQIERMIISKEQFALTSLDLSYNELTSPGRLLLYVPVLASLNLQGNQLQGMGKYRSDRLESLDVSSNQINHLNWLTQFPGLHHLDLSRNGISDISPLLDHDHYRWLDSLSLRDNPLSKQAFHEILPLLKKEILSFAGPDTYQPLSPCYVNPEPGFCRPGNQIRFDWRVEPPEVPVRYEFRVFAEDTLVKTISEINESRTFLEVEPGSRFFWQVGTITADTLFWSGRYEVKAYDQFSLPFYEDFEMYPAGHEWQDLSPYWNGKPFHFRQLGPPRVDSLVFFSGNQSLRIEKSQGTSLFLSHLDHAVVRINFALWIPPQRMGTWMIKGLQGMDVEVRMGIHDLGTIYLNNTEYADFDCTHADWMLWHVVVHARNNRLFIYLDDHCILNEPLENAWDEMGIDQILFSAASPNGADTDPPSLLYLDDLSVEVPQGTSTEMAELSDSEVVIFPNPCRDHCTLTLPESGELICISLFDSRGALIFDHFVTRHDPRELTLNMGCQKPGLYLIRIAARSEVEMKQLVVQ